MHTAWQTWVKAAHGAHDVDALELVWAILLEDGRVLHGIFIRPGGAIDVAHAAVPGSGRIGLVGSDLAALDDHVVRSAPRTASWKPQPMASLGTVNSFQVR